MARITVESALQTLKEKKTPFAELFKHGSLVVEFYQPDGKDEQTPHDRDEIYLVVSGSGNFINGEESTPFSAGDFLFAPAGVEHRFIDFTSDFATWVFFYGPVGGEAK